MNEIDDFYLNLKEPLKSTLFALRGIILNLDSNVTDGLRYKMPFFFYKDKMFCYFWTHKKTKEPYIGIVEGHRINHPLLEKGNRSRIKIFNVSTTEDIPVDTIEELLQTALDFYRNGLIRTKK